MLPSQGHECHVDLLSYTPPLMLPEGWRSALSYLSPPLILYPIPPPESALRFVNSRAFFCFLIYIVRFLRALVRSESRIGYGVQELTCLYLVLFPYSLGRITKVVYQCTSISSVSKFLLFANICTHCICTPFYLSLPTLPASSRRLYNMP